MPLLTIRRRPTPPASPREPPDSPLVPATVVDHLAPRAAEVVRDHLWLEGTYAAGLAVTELPRTTQPGQLLQVVTAGLPCDLAFHIDRIGPTTARRFLDRQATVHGAGQRHAVRYGQLNDPERDTALEDAQALRAALGRGQERLFRVSIYALARAGSPAALHTLLGRLADLFGTAELRVRRTVLQQLQAFRSCLPQLTDELDDEQYVSTSVLATLIPWSTGRLDMPGGVLWGLRRGSGSPVRVNLFANPPLTDANAVVFARVRQGKSFLLKLIVRRFLASAAARDADGQPLPVAGRCVVVDAEAKQEYRPLCEDLGGQYVRLGPGSPVRINPFDLPPCDPEDDDLRDPQREHIASLLRFCELLLADRGKQLSGDEVAICDLALGATYARAQQQGRTPLLADLLWVLRHPDDTLPDVDLALVRSLATRLARWVSGSLAELFREPTNVEIDNPLVVFNVAALDETLRPIGVHLIEHFVWTQQRWRSIQGEEAPCLLVVDELWLTLRSAEGGQFLETIARKGPKYWLGLVCASQEPADRLTSPYGQAIVDNSSTRVLLALDSGVLETAAAGFGLTPHEVGLVQGAAPGEALLLCAGERVFMEIVATEHERLLASTTPAELAERNRQRRRQTLHPGQGSALATPPAEPALDPDLIVLIPLSSAWRSRL